VSAGAIAALAPGPGLHRWSGEVHHLEGAGAEIRVYRTVAAAAEAVQAAPG
jgi:hypothetical protein